MKMLTAVAVTALLMFLLSCGKQQGQEEQTGGADLYEQQIQYTSDGDTLDGYLVYDNSIKGKRPGVLVVHEWWGQNEYARKRARMLAKLGYTAFALDMYGNGKQATHPADAQKFATEAMQHMDVSKARFMAALKLLRSNETVNPEEIAAIGYCFGGGIVLRMAEMGVDLKGVVSFHGVLPADQKVEPGQVKASVLVCQGADDPFTTPEQLAAFNNEMEKGEVDYEFESYPGAVHSFTNPMADSLGQKFNLPLAYNKAADQQSWAAMKEFFKRIFAN